MSNTATANRALLCDRYFGALVDRSGFVEWLSLPRFRGDRWKGQREEIWDIVVRDGWSEGAAAFTQYVRSSALDGLVGQARNVFERAAGFANDLGLLAGEADTETGELLDKFPQAFRHTGSATPPRQSAKPSDQLILDHVPSP